MGLSGGRATQPLSPQMPGRRPFADDCTRVYTRTGKKAHLLKPLASPNTYLTALCGTGPEWFEAWRGTGTQDEHETAASLPLCKYCEKHARSEDDAAQRRAERGAS